MKKNIHFFGCSNTVGHELPDQDIFPWIHECKTVKEYYARFQSVQPLTNYISECKKFAYPSIIHSLNNNFECVNHAELGSSIKNEMYKTIQLIESEKENIDFIVFQIPSSHREMMISNIDGKLFNCILHNILPDTEIALYHNSELLQPELQEYAKYKILSHSPMHWDFHGELELLMFQGYLESKNIPHVLILLEPGIEKSLQYYFNKTAEIFRISDYITVKRSIGGHFDRATHEEFAKYIKMLIDDKLAL